METDTGRKAMIKALWITLAVLVPALQGCVAEQKIAREAEVVSVREAIDGTISWGYCQINRRSPLASLPDRADAVPRPDSGGSA